jgi:hypothetical protein
MMLAPPVIPHRCPDPPLRVPFPGRGGRWVHVLLDDRLTAFPSGMLLSGIFWGNQQRARAGDHGSWRRAV